MISDPDEWKAQFDGVGKNGSNSKDSQRKRLSQLHQMLRDLENDMLIENEKDPDRRVPAEEEHGTLRDGKRSRLKKNTSYTQYSKVSNRKETDPDKHASPYSRPQYPPNPGLHSLVVSSFAKADPKSHNHISPHVLASTMWEVETALAKERITAPHRPFWLARESKNGGRPDKRNLSESQRNQLDRYRRRKSEYESRREEITDRIVEEYGLSKATKAREGSSPKREGKPIAKMLRDGAVTAMLSGKGGEGSYLSFVADGLALYRERKNHGPDYESKRAEFMHNVLTKAQVEFAKNRTRNGQPARNSMDSIPGVLLTLLSQLQSGSREKEGLKQVWELMEAGGAVGLAKKVLPGDLKKILPGDHSEPKRLEGKPKRKKHHSHHSDGSSKSSRSNRDGHSRSDARSSRYIEDAPRSRHSHSHHDDYPENSARSSKYNDGSPSSQKAYYDDPSAIEARSSKHGDESHRKHRSRRHSVEPPRRPRGPRRHSTGHDDFPKYAPDVASGRMRTPQSRD